MPHSRQFLLEPEYVGLHRKQQIDVAQPLFAARGWPDERFPTNPVGLQRKSVDEGATLLGFGVWAPSDAPMAMKTRLQNTRVPAAAAGAASACALLMAGFASNAAPAAPPVASPAADATRAALACKVTSNCVNSLGTSGLGPLRFEGTPTQAMEALRATLAKFPQAKIVKTDAVSMEVVFTTFLGFRDLVDFRIDAEAQRIDFRSRSLVGKYDLGKNRSRMAQFSTQFAARGN